jgi:hypothetical protein
MARRDRPVNNAALREYLLGQAKSMVAFHLGHDWPLGGVSSYEPTEREITETPFGGDVQELASGAAYRLRRSDLPHWHVESIGGPYDEFLLDENDVLHPL